MTRGEVWWASLPAPTGSGPGFRRPALVLQSDPFNAAGSPQLSWPSSPRTMRWPKRGQRPIEQGESGLTRASVVNVSQIVTLDRKLLTQRVRALPAATLHRIDDGVRLVLGLQRAA